MAEEEKTYGYQDDLPPLPVPDLGETLQKYLQTVEPLLTEEELEHTRAVVADFEKGIGRTLHASLVERAKDERNWMEEWWEMFGYLMPRYPAAVNINWFGIVPGTWGREVDQATAAAFFAAALLDCWKCIDEERLPVEKMAGQPLCMHQFTRAFGTCKVPGETMDYFATHEDEPVARHITILRDSLVYEVQVVHEDGTVANLSELQWLMAEVLSDSRGMFSLDAEPPVSVLTSEERTQWWKAREHMISVSELNEASFDSIQRSLFALSLPSYTPPETDKEKCFDILCGDGRDIWFDKPFTLRVHTNGVATVNGEHAWADAMTLVTIFSYVINHVKSSVDSGALPPLLERPPIKPEGLSMPRRLKWSLDAKAMQYMESASVAIDALGGDIEVEVLTFVHYGRDFVKRYRLFPDFYVQMAIQLAHYRLHNFFVATYETGHTRLFYHGRTATCRTLSTQSVAFVQAMCDPTKSDGDRFDALKTAISAHREYMKSAMLGEGVDRCLLGMLIASEMSGIKPKPALFTDKAFTISKRYRISTSNIGKTNLFGGFAPMYDDGYGVCYGIRPGRINIAITAHHSYEPTSAKAMKAALSDALIDMQKLLLTRNVIYVGSSKL